MKFVVSIFNALIDSRKSTTLLPWDGCSCIRAPKNNWCFNFQSLGKHLLFLPSPLARNYGYPFFRLFFTTNRFFFTHFSSVTDLSRPIFAHFSSVTDLCRHIFDHFLKQTVRLFLQSNPVFWTRLSNFGDLQ